MKTEGGIRKPFFDMTHVFLWKIGLIFIQINHKISFFKTANSGLHDFTCTFE